MSMEEDKFSFRLCGDFKQSRIRHETLEIILPAYQSDLKLCIVRILGFFFYLDKTAPLRKSSKLFISTIRPFYSVSKDTISRFHAHPGVCLVFATQVTLPLIQLNCESTQIGFEE